MINLLDYKLWLACIGALFIAAAGGFYYGDNYATKAAEIAEQGRTATALAKLAKEDKAVLDQERGLRKADADKFNTFKRENDDAHAYKDRTISDLRRDNTRLRIPVRPHSEAAAPAGGPAAAGAVNDGYAELTQDAAEFLVDLLARGDEGIRKHAEVVARYNRLRTACTTDALPPPTGESP